MCEWKRVTRGICHRKVPTALKEKVYRTQVEPSVVLGENGGVNGRGTEMSELNMLWFSLWE